MSNSIIEKLLNGAEVEWMPLGEVLIRTKGTKITAGQMKELHKENAPVKIFAGGKTFAFVDFFDIPEKDINTEPSIIVKSRGIIEFEYYDKPFSHKNEMWSYHSKNENIDVKFIYYFLKQNEPYFQNIGSKMQMPQIATPDTDKFLVPIPGLQTQQKIVKTLDKFTELEATLEATLEAELALRKKQYQYYRETLLTFPQDLDRGGYNEITKALYHSGNVVFKTLGEVCDIYLGLTYTPNYVDNGIKFISAQNTSNDFLDLKNVKYISKDDYYKITSNAKPKKGDILFTRVGSNLGHPVIIDVEDELCIFVSLGYLRVKDGILNTYVKHWMNTKLFWDQVSKNVHGSAKINLNTGWLKKFTIAVPPISEQQKIVEILDKFDRLTNSISEGLPKEIELRRKQYEYYREQLLNFPK